MDCFNIHTHTLVNPESEIISYSPGLYPTDPRIVYSSIGIHPWYLTEENAEDQWKTLKESVNEPRIRAIGEARLDKLKGAPIKLQTSIFQEEKEKDEMV